VFALDCVSYINDIIQFNFGIMPRIQIFKELRFSLLAGFSFIDIMLALHEYNYPVI